MKDVLTDILTAGKLCKLCRAKVKWEIKEQKRQFKLIGTHFCKWANGNCTLTLTVGKKLDHEN
jgi:hypothetical protein